MNSPLSPLLSAVGRSWWILLLYGLVALGFGIIGIDQWPTIGIEAEFGIVGIEAEFGIWQGFLRRILRRNLNA